MLNFEPMLKKNKKRLGMLTNYYEFWGTNSKHINNETKVQWILSAIISTSGATNFCARKSCFRNCF